MRSYLSLIANQSIMVGLTRSDAKKRASDLFDRLNSRGAFQGWKVGGWCTSDWWNPAAAEAGKSRWCQLSKERLVVTAVPMLTQLLLFFIIIPNRCFNSYSTTRSRRRELLFDSIAFAFSSYPIDILNN